MLNSSGISTLNSAGFTSTNGFAVLVCLLAAILVLALKLHKKVVYRLALYQVLAAFALGVVELSQISMVRLQENPEAYNRACIAIAFFGMYSQWVKLIFTVWVSFHLFYFAVFHKNLKRFEALYIVTSLLLPAVITVIPLITSSYGYSPVDGCYIPVYDDNGTKILVGAVETFALWDAPAMIMLLITSAAMVVMVIKLTRNLCWRSKYEPITENDQYWNALKQLFPLATFPIVFFLFIIPVVIYDIYYSFLTPTPNRNLTLSSHVFVSLWSVASGIALTVHICIAQLPTALYMCRNFKKRLHHNHLSFTHNTVGSQTDLPANSATSFPLPADSLRTSIDE